MKAWVVIEDETPDDRDAYLVFAPDEKSAAAVLGDFVMEVIRAPEGDRFYTPGTVISGNPEAMDAVGITPWNWTKCPECGTWHQDPDWDECGDCMARIMADE